MYMEAILGTVVSSVVSGIIGNKADRIAMEAMTLFADNFFNKGRRDDNQDLQKAVLRSYYHALKDICKECLKKEKNNDETSRWLKTELEEAESSIKRIERNDYNFLPIEEFDQIKLLLVTESIAANDIENEKEKLISYALQRGSIPLSFENLVRHSFFEKICMNFEYEIKYNKEVKSIFESKMLSNIDINILDLRKALEEHMDTLDERMNIWNKRFNSLDENNLNLNKKIDRILECVSKQPHFTDPLMFNPESQEQDRMLKEACVVKDSSEPHVLDGVEGIVTKDALNINRKLPGEVFAIELLTEDIFLEKNKDITKVKIDRRNTQHVVISNAGKVNLNKKMIEDKNLEERLRRRDSEIQSFLNSSSSNAKPYDRISLKELGICLRWASGGMLPIVEYHTRKYIPFLYRDKEPFGWNLFLGSADRQFDKYGKVISEAEEEYNNPSRFIAREFEEELLVFETEPDPDKEDNKIIPISLPYRHDNYSEKFCRKHLQLRKRYDGLHINEDSNRSINCKLADTKMELQIINRTGEIIKPFSDIIVCFNLLELGIEAVQVIKFKLDKGNVLLDGEILSLHDDELVRMPIALISCDFLERKFRGDLRNVTYTSGVNPSVKIDEPIPKDEMILFDYDLKERLKVINKSKAIVGPLEEQRYNASFEKYFDSNTCTVKDEYTMYFTPSAAKILNLMFEQVDPKEYRT